MNLIHRHSLNTILLGLLSFVVGLLFLIFSNYDFMELFLGYLFASLILLFSIIMIVITFLRENEHFFRIFFYVFLIAISVWFFLNPTHIVLMIPIVIGVFLSVSGLVLIIKFIILKRANFGSYITIIKFVIYLLLIVAGILISVFYLKIDTVITSFLLGVPLMSVGVLFIALGVMRLIRNH